MSEETEFVKEKQEHDFETFIKYELGLTEEKLEKTDVGAYKYKDKGVDMLWFFWNAGYWTRQTHIMTYGDSALRKFGIRDINESMEIDKQ